MPIYGLMQSLASVAAHTLMPNASLAIAGHSLPPVAPSFPSYAERQAYTGMPLSVHERYSALASLRYERWFESIHGSLLGRGHNSSSASAPRDDMRKADASGVRVRRSAATVSAPQPLNTNRSAHLFARAYAAAFDLTVDDAHARLKADDLSLYQSWETLSSTAQIDAPPAASVLASSAAGRAHAAALLATYLQLRSETDDDTAIGIAQLYLRRLAPTSLDQPARAALYQALLQRGLQWIDMAKVDSKKLSATHILQTVCRYRKVALHTRSGLTERLQHERDVIVDEAALIAAHTAQGVLGVPMAQMRAQFATALIDEWQDAALAQLLLPSSVLPPEHAQFWYDGSVMRNTRGKNLEQIVSILYAATPQAEDSSMQRLITQANRSRYLLAQPESLIAAWQRQQLIEGMHGDPATLMRYASRPDSLAIGGVWLTRDELYAIVEKGMRDLALDIDYASGTPLHAIATIVHRLGPLHGIDFDAFNNPSALMDAYNQLEQAWQYSPDYPIKPSLCAAHFLAQSSDVRLVDQASTLSSEQQIAQQVAADILPALQQAGASFARQSDYWNATISSFLQGTGSDYSRFTIASVPAGKMAIYNSLQALVVTLKRAPEIIQYADSKDLASQLEVYLKQRLLAQAPLPSYNEDFLIEQILRQKLWMRDANLHKKYPAGDPYLGPNISRQLWVAHEMTPIDIFKQRLLSLDSEMRFGVYRIDAAQTLNIAQQQALAALRDNPIVIAKAKEILRQHAHVNTVSVVDELRSILARSIVGLPPELSALDAVLALLNTVFSSPTLTSIVNALDSGEPRQIIGLLPFVVPLYDIEEGMRRGDRQRAFEGALHFGEDALFTLLGAGVEGGLRRQLAHDAERMLLARSRMSAAERAGVDMVREMAQAFPQAAAQRLAQRRVTIAEDAFNVWIPTQTLPKMLEAQRRPDNHLHQTLYLSDEQRIVLVQSSGNGLVEVNLRGQLVPAASPIFGSVASGRGYRLSRRVGLPGGAMGVDASELLLRHTVSSVQRFWKSVTGLHNIRIRHAEPKALINALFKNASSAPHGAYVAFEQFWLKAYALSDTAVVILNAAYQRLISCGSYCELEFNAERARVRGDSITFLDAQRLAKLQYVAFDGMENFQPERMWVHEAIHWTTKLGDALEGEASDSRGATPYLTDRILSEVGAYPPLLQRIAYQAPPAFEADEMAHRVWSGRLRRLYDWNIAENNVIDTTLNVGRDFPATMMVLGQRITERITVRQGLALSEHIKSLGKFGAGNAEYLLQQFRAQFKSSSWSSNSLVMMRRLMLESKTFRILAAVWGRKIQYERLEIGLKNFDLHYADASLSQPLAHHISSGGEQIWLNSKPLYYFSDFDVVALSDMRRYTGAMIDLFLRDMIPTEQRLRLPNPFVERGLDVLLENEILRQIGIKEPRRISAQLSLDSESYLRHQTTTSRAAINENGYLHQVCSGGQAAADDDILALFT